jgi:hypothetical protein
MALKRSGLAAAILALTLTGGPALAETFSFVALGDMPYGEPAKTYPRFEALIGEINRRKPAFSIHVGDIKSGSTPCSDAYFAEQLAFMNSFESALIYTPGDNEWTDCHRRDNGGFDPLERLARLRSMFFTAPRSLGRAPIALERQSDLDAARSLYVENVRFAREGVHVLTAHVVGSNNNLEARDPKAAAEFFARDAANVDWLKGSFAKAREQGAKAIVIAFQADIFEFDWNNFNNEGHLRHSGFINFTDTLIKEAAEFARPVLIIYGDSHHFRVHVPFEKKAANVIALEVFGARFMHAVEVTVDTNDSAVFGFRPVLNPMR